MRVLGTVRNVDEDAVVSGLDRVLVDRRPALSTGEDRANGDNEKGHSATMERHFFSFDQICKLNISNDLDTICLHHSIVVATTLHVRKLDLGGDSTAPSEKSHPR